MKSTQMGFLVEKETHNTPVSENRKAMCICMTDYRSGGLAII